MAFVFEELNGAPVFDVDYDSFVTHPRKNRKGEIYDSFYWKTEELYMDFGPEREYKVQGVYLNNLEDNEDALTKETASLAVEDRCITLPNFQVDAIKQILASDDAIDQIIEGKVYVTIEPYYHKRFKQDFYKVVFHTVA